MATIEYTPDILNCLANLSNDEVFTPPEVVNQMLDMLPADLWTNPDARFLDPVSKTGVFLREIAKRLMRGLAKKIPDKQARANHIFTTQLFGIAITEMTSFLSRRTVYCSKIADGEYSVCTEFADDQGNIMYERLSHTWEGGRCKYCGASQSVYERGDNRETYAYQFIHTDKPEKFFNDMKFDVIIGNPPYQLSDGGAQASAIPIYNQFVEQAKKLRPRYLSMIIPSRWMTGGRGLDEFRDKMINDKHFTVLHDFINSDDCFTGVEIKGGVCYFLWERDAEDKCDIYLHTADKIEYSKRFLVEKGDNIFIRQNTLIKIRDKVWCNKPKSFDILVSSMKPYGLRGDIFKDQSKYGLPEFSINPIPNGYKILGLNGSKREYRYIPNTYPLPKKDMLNDYKIFIPRNWGVGDLSDLPSALVLAEPKELCTETFIQIGPFTTKKEMRNAYSYFCCKFFRALVGIRKQDQGASKAIYQFVPLQDFNEPWTDEKLYKKYGLTEDEIAFIESMIRPMEG